MVGQANYLCFTFPLFMVKIKYVPPYLWLRLNITYLMMVFSYDEFVITLFKS
jgi:hypothetical protein